MRNKNRLLYNIASILPRFFRLTRRFARPVCTGSPPARLAWTALAVLLCAGLFYGVGCTNKGTVEIRLSLPEENDLNPIEDDGLREFRLLVRRGTHIEVKAATWSRTHPGFSIGELDPGPVDVLALSGYTIDGRLICYGRTGPAEIPDGGSTTIPMTLRRPISYVSGAALLQPFDTSRERNKQLLLPIELGSVHSRTLSVATTPDGRYVLVLTESPHTLVVLSTSTHQVIRQHSLSNEPAYMAVSADGQWVVLVDPRQNLPSNNVAIYSLSAVINTNNTQPTFTDAPFDKAPAGIPGFVRLSNGQERVVVLGQRLPIDFDCANLSTDPNSNLYLIDPYTGQVTATILLGAPARAVAAGPGSDLVFVALTCKGEVAAINPNTQNVQTRYAVSKPTALVMSAPFESSTYLFVGNASEAVGSNPAELVINVNDLQNFNGEERTSFFKEHIVIGSNEGINLSLTLAPETVRVTRLSAPPGQQRISLLVYARYANAPFTWENADIPANEVVTRTYITYDLTRKELGGRFRASCEVSPSNNFCEDVQQGLQADSDFTPTGIATIYGSQ